MEKIIKCTQCQEILGTLRKDVITEEDILEYKAMTVCSQEHVDMVDVVQEDEQEI